MTTSTATEAAREQQLNAILLTLVQALEKGQSPDREQFLAAHPEFAAELAGFFADRDYLQRLTAQEPGGFRPSSLVADQGQLGDFRLLREVGRGGMGIVYEARQISLDRRVALKVLPLAAALDPRQLQRFKNEAQAAALLHHPHIVQIHAVGCDRGVHYYAMQFIEGRSLAGMIQGLRRAPGGQAPAAANSSVLTHRLPSTPSPSPLEESAAGVSDAVTPPAAMSTARSTWKSQYFRRVAHLGKEAAEALDHAHQTGVVHRDIKPANLLLDRRGELWITDFGVALLQSNAGLTTTGELVGTLRYMSPEQAGAQRGLVDHRTDIYSLGATLYEMLTLRPPFAGNDPRHLLHQIATEDPRPPRALDRAIPVELELIVLKAMAKHPDERYASAQELADDLQRFLGDQPIRARRPSLLDRALKWSRRHKAMVVSGLVLLLLATAGLLVSTVLIARSKSEVQDAYQRELQKEKEAQQQRTRAETNLTQARQAVDFLTQVSAEELGQKPEFLHVRQKLLEGALQYYQQFIDQHQDDPSIQAELAASRARVAQILSALSAQQEYLRLMLRAMLLEEKTVQKDLRLTPSQEEKITDLSERLTAQRQETFTTSFALSEQERGQQFKKMAATNEAAVAAILTPAQAKRLKQIALQKRSPHAFDDAEAAEALHLTPDQTARIRPYLDEVQRNQGEASRTRTKTAEVDQKVQQIAQNAEQVILALLTPEQRATWKEMTGEPFRGEIHFSPQSSFVRPGSGHPGPMLANFKFGFRERQGRGPGDGSPRPGAGRFGPMPQQPPHGFRHGPEKGSRDGFRGPGHGLPPGIPKKK